MTTVQYYLHNLFLSLMMSQGASVELENCALHKPAWDHPPEGKTHKPENAVDGDFNTNNVYCSHTWEYTNGTIPDQVWWTVDLQDFYDIVAVAITNRGDCCGFRLSNFDLDVYSMNPVFFSSEERKLCFHQDSPIGDGKTVRFNCIHPMRGRFLKVNNLILSQPLHMCEVQVLAYPRMSVVKEQMFRILTNQKATQGVLKEVPVPSEMQCVASCFREPACTGADLEPAIFPEQATRKCRLLDYCGIKQQAPCNESQDGWTLYVGL